MNNFEFMAKQLTRAVLETVAARGGYLSAPYPGVSWAGDVHNRETAEAAERKVAVILADLFPTFPDNSMEFYARMTPGAPGVYGSERRILTVWRDGFEKLRVSVTDPNEPHPGAEPPDRSTVVCHYVLPPLE